MKKIEMKQIAVAAMLTVGIVGAALAGTDTTFGTYASGGAGAGAVGTIGNWLQGSMGKMFSIGALAVGLGIGIVKQSVMSVAVGTGIALAASSGPQILNSIFGAVL